MTGTGGGGQPPPLSAVEKLSKAHDLSHFDCGKSSLDDWLKRFARTSQASDAAQTYVVHRAGAVVGYFSLSYGSVAWEEAPARIVRGLARHPVPVVLLARLAVDRSEQGKGLGEALLKEALLRIEQAADIAGARALLVHAIDDDAGGFYQHFGFEPSPLDPMTLMLLMKDLRGAANAGAEGDS